MAVTVSRMGVVLVLVLGLTACTAAPEPPAPTSTVPVVQLGAPGEGNRTLSPEEAAALGSPAHVDADVVFVRDMLHHHAQAVLMTGYVEANSSSSDVLLLAERMQISQEGEMGQLEQWLQDRGEPVRDPDGGHDAHVLMPGMLSEEELADLEAADGEAFDVLFLKSMIRHHEGAVAMIEDLYTEGGGQESVIGEMARHFDSDQRIEISRMAEMLAERGE